MTDIDTLFEKRRLLSERLLPFGFSKKKNAYIYSTTLLGGQFEMVVTLAKEGAVSAKVIDAVSKDPYILHRVAGAKGAFAGALRKEYEGVLTAIAEACFEPDVFTSGGARQVIRYVREKYGDEPQFLWKRFPDNAIFRRKDNAKWYAALLTVKREKLGLREDGAIEIIDVRMKPEHIDAVVDGKRYLPGYHMNKKHWVTLCLDGSVAAEEIFRRIDESFSLAVK